MLKKLITDQIKEADGKIDFFLLIELLTKKGVQHYVIRSEVLHMVSNGELTLRNKKVELVEEKV